MITAWVLLIFMGKGTYSHPAEIEKVPYKSYEACIEAQELIKEEIDAETIPYVKTLCISTGD